MKGRRGIQKGYRRKDAKGPRARRKKEEHIYM
jgi:hypothetical protein